MQDSPATPGFSSAPKPLRRILQPLYCVPFTNVKPESPDTANFYYQFQLSSCNGALSYICISFTVLVPLRGRKFPRPFGFISWKLSRVGSHPEGSPTFIPFHSGPLLTSFSTSPGSNIKFPGILFLPQTVHFVFLFLSNPSIFIV